MYKGKLPEGRVISWNVFPERFTIGVPAPPSQQSNQTVCGFPCKFHISVLGLELGCQDF